MIRPLLAVSIVLASFSTAFAKKYPWAHYDLNFIPGKIASASHLGMCDDSYYAGFTVSLPGRQGVEFKVKSVQMDRGCALKGSKQESVNGFLRTIYFIEGQCQGTIQFESTRGHDKADMEISDAC